MARAKIRKQDAKPGQVWRFPLRDRSGFGYLRVVLDVGRLQLPKDSPLAFVNHCYLVQVSRSSTLGPQIFDEGEVLVDGVFLAPEDPWEARGYELVGDSEVSPGQIELPCWFSNISVGLEPARQVFCRGELRYECPGLDRDVVEGRWGSPYLERRFPVRLSQDIAEGPTLTDRFRRTDVRYHPLRQEILERISVDISQPYMSLVATAGTGDRYLRAVQG